MSKLYSPGHSTWGNEIAENSLVVTSQDLVTIKAWYVDLAVAWDTVVGISLETKTFDADNQTVKQEELVYASLADNTIVEVAVENGTIAQANVWAVYDLSANSIVDGATSATGTQLKLKKVLSTVLGLFQRAK